MPFKLISSRSLLDDEIESLRFSSQAFMINRRRALSVGCGVLAATTMLAFGGTGTQARTAGEALSDLVKSTFGGHAPKLASAVVPPQSSPNVQVAALNPTNEPQSGVLLANFTTADNQDFQDRTSELTIQPGGI